MRRLSTPSHLALALATSCLSVIASLLPAVADDGVANDGGTGAGSGTVPTPSEVESLTTETSQVVALPDGKFKLISHQQPVRTKQNGEWVSIDTTLEQATDGSYRPRAAAVPLSFSGGGDSAPLLTMGEDGAMVSMDWDAPLPDPSVEGDSLTYPDVRPGVDLILTAHAKGYSQVLVVHNRQAALELAANPAALTVEGEGLNIARSSDGAISASGSGVSFTGAPPMQWDSSGLPGGEGTADDSGTSEIRHVDATFNRIDSNSLEVEIAPPALTLSDTSTTYPIYVDPKMSEAGQPHTLTVHSGGWDYYDDPSEPLRVGYCGWSECTSAQGNSRSFFSFNLSALSGTTADPHIENAVVKVYQLWNASSSPTAVNLTKANPFDASTNYPGPVGAHLQQVSSSAGAGGNNQGWLTFANANVDQYIADTVAVEGKVARFSLSTPTPNDKYLWKKFGNTSAYNPTIEVTYVFPPARPTDLTLVDAIDCNGETTRITNRYLGLRARAVDQNPTPLTLDHHFEVWRDSDGVAGIDTATDTRHRYNNTHSSDTRVPSGAWAQFYTSWGNSANTNPSSDGVYYFRDRASNDASDTGIQYSPWSSWKVFALDTIRPDTPTLMSHDYPEDHWGASLASPGTFHATSSSDVVGFSYAFDGESVPAITGCDYSVANGKTGYVPAIGGAATITAPASLEQGVRHTLTVRSFDKAHLMSGVSTTYSFYVPLTVAGVSSSSAFTTFPKFRYEAESPAVTDTLIAGSDIVSIAPDPASSGGQEAVIAPATLPGPPTPSEPAVVTYNLPVPVPGYYALGVDFNQRPDGGQVEFRRFDDTITAEQSQPITADTYAADPAAKYVPLGGVSVNGETLKLSVVITGKNADSAGYLVAIDKFHLVPLRGAAATNLTAAFDNKGIGVENSWDVAALAAGTNQALSKASLTAVGLTPGSNASGGTATVGGVTFTMPPVRVAADGKVYDNAVSAGQEILMPTNTPVPSHSGGQGQVPGHVNLLVAATCRDIDFQPTDSTHAMSIRYSDGSAEGEASGDRLVSRVPQWLAPREAGIPGVTLDRYLQGTTVITTPKPTLYVLRFPVHVDYVTGGYTVKSITLPRIGTDLRDDCSTAALHVFAVALTNN